MPSKTTVLQKSYDFFFKNNPNEKKILRISSYESPFKKIQLIVTHQLSIDTSKHV